MDSRSLLERLGSRRLLIVTGKGGVGKTAVAGALGRVLARPRRKVLVVEVDPRENLHQMLGVRPSGGDLVAAGADLWVQNLRPRQVVDAAGARAAQARGAVAAGVGQRGL